MDFIVGNYSIFIIIAIVLLLGLFGYMMDRKKYEKYREEIINEERIADALEAAPGYAMDPTMQQAPQAPQMQTVQPVAPQGQVQQAQPVNTQTPIN